MNGIEKKRSSFETPLWMVLPNIIWILHGLLLILLGWCGWPKDLSLMIGLVLILLPLSILGTVASLIHIFQRKTPWAERIGVMLLQLISLAYVTPWILLVSTGGLNLN